MEFKIDTFEQYQSIYAHSIAAPEAFWASVAENFLWKRKWDKVLDWNFHEPQIVFQ